MNFQNFKIIPLMIFVAMLAFSVRFAEVAMGLAMLPGEALAAAAEEATSTPPPAGELKSAAEDAAADTLKEEDAKAEAEKAAAKAAEDKTAAKTEEKTADAPKEGEKKDGEAQPMAAGDKPPEIEPVEWHDAGDSDSEFSNTRSELYDDLAKRRADLDKRESDMVTREALLRAAEQEIDRKYNELSQLRGELEKLMQKQSDEEQARIASLVKIYEGMKPADAARIFDTLDVDILMSVMSHMSERKLSPVMALMNPERAKTMTIMMAEQKKLPSLPPSQ